MNGMADQHVFNRDQVLYHSFIVVEDHAIMNVRSITNFVIFIHEQCHPNYVQHLYSQQCRYIAAGLMSCPAVDSFAQSLNLYTLF